MKKEKRSISFKDIEVRSSKDNDKKIIEGLIPYNSKSVPIWGTVEIIDKTAFNKTLSDKSEVRALWNHNDNYILGNTKANTLELENSDAGLICRCELPNTTYANDLFEIIDRGDVKTMSFGFTPIKYLEDDKGKLRTLKEVQLHEISFGVTYPAYEKTTSLAYLRGLNKININLETLNETLEKDQLEENDKLIIKQMIDSLSNLLGTEAVEKEPVENTTPKNEEVNTPDTKIDIDEERKKIQLETEIELEL